MIMIVLGLGVPLGLVIVRFLGLFQRQLVRRQITRLHAGGSGDRFAGKSGCLHEAGHPAFEMKAVLDQDLGLAERLGVLGRWLEDMGVAVRSDQGGDGDVVTADLLHHVAENREGRHDLQRLGHGRREGEGGGGKRQREGKRASYHRSVLEGDGLVQ